MSTCVEFKIKFPMLKVKAKVRSKVKILSQQLLKNYWSKFNETLQKY